MERVSQAESCLQRSVSFKPQKILYPLSKLMKEKLEIDNLGREISILVVYFIKKHKDKNFIKELKNINNDIIRSNITIPHEILE